MTVPDFVLKNLNNPRAYTCLSFECYAVPEFFNDDWEDTVTPEDKETMTKQGGLPCVATGISGEPSTYCLTCHWCLVDEC